MTESIRRSGAYENPQGHGEQSAYPGQQGVSTPVNPEWPPPPAYAPHMGPTTAGAGDGHGYGSGDVHGEHAVTPLLAEPGSPGDGRSSGGSGRRARGPRGLLAAVAIVAAVIGGGTAYGIQELTGHGTTTAAATSNGGTSVVPVSQKGTVAGVARAVGPSIVEISATSNAGRSTGSGVIITSDGEIVTNNHVVSGASTVTVTTSNGKEYRAEVVGTDSGKDLALIKLENASGLKAAALGDSDDVQVGDQVVAIGSPEGLTGTVTSGIVSALDRDVTVSTGEEGRQQQQQQGGGWPFEFGGRQFNGDTGDSTTTYKALQTDASLNPGNSGGALIDMNGRIIGINSAMYSSASSSDAGSVGLGFAIPVNTVKTDLSALRAGGSGN